jgi:hypothetical protein
VHLRGLGRGLCLDFQVISSSCVPLLLDLHFVWMAALQFLNKNVDVFESKINTASTAVNSHYEDEYVVRNPWDALDLLARVVAMLVCGCNAFCLLLKMV